MSQADDNAFGREFLDQITSWIGSNMEPADIFEEKKLEEWATDNGFIKGDA